MCSIGMVLEEGERLPDIRLPKRETVTPALLRKQEPVEVIDVDDDDLEEVR